MENKAQMKKVAFNNWSADLQQIFNILTKYSKVLE